LFSFVDLHPNFYNCTQDLLEAYIVKMVFLTTWALGAKNTKIFITIVCFYLYRPFKLDYIQLYCISEMVHFKKSPIKPFFTNKASVGWGKI
jgi:hypothetical protein